MDFQVGSDGEEELRVFDSLEKEKDFFEFELKLESEEPQGRILLIDFVHQTLNRSVN